jgi:hypothetical protein
VETEPSLEEFRPSKLQVSINRLGFIKGLPFEFELGRKLVQKMGAFTKSYNTDKYTKVYIKHSCKSNASIEGI